MPRSFGEKRFYLNSDRWYSTPNPVTKHGKVRLNPGSVTAFPNLALAVPAPVGAEVSLAGAEWRGLLCIANGHGIERKGRGGGDGQKCVPEVHFDGMLFALIVEWCILNALTAVYILDRRRRKFKARIF
jgi:hypothetical protein